MGPNALNIEMAILESKPNHPYPEDFNLDFFGWREDGITPLTGATTPVLAVASNIPTITWAASNVDGIGYCFTLPREFDESARGLKLHLTLNMGGATDTPTVSVSIYATGPGDAAAKGPFTVATPALDATKTQYILDFTDLEDGNGDQIDAGDTLYIDLTPGAHTTDTLVMSGTTLEIRRNACYHDIDARYAAQVSTLT